eukprot:scaffold5546_cov247-Pinguiococcus_pyrenoidosus.AAC.6
MATGLPIGCCSLDPRSGRELAGAAIIEVLDPLQPALYSFDLTPRGEDPGATGTQDARARLLPASLGCGSMRRPPDGGHGPAGTDGSLLMPLRLGLRAAFAGECRAAEDATRRGSHPRVGQQRARQVPGAEPVPEQRPGQRGPLRPARVPPDSLGLGGAERESRAGRGPPRREGARGIPA